jgi:HlyD family secretion protein
MDVVKEKPSKKNKFLDKKHLVGIMLATVVVVLAFMASQSAGTASVLRSDILMDKVQYGDLEVVIEGYGNLTSDKQKLLTSLTRATVKEIVLKPGAVVTTDSIIVRLENQELLQQIDNTQQELAQAHANLRQLKLNQQRTLLDESAKMAEITASYETARLKRRAEEKLVKEGIVSRLTFQASQLNEKQYAKRLEILMQRIEQLKLVQKEAINIQQEKIKQQQGRQAIAQSRLDALVVKAGFEGVLQRLSVELGQSLAAGQEIALIGSTRHLIALIKVPQNQAQQISIGQKAIIDTRRDKIEGRVARIDPIVVDNTVNIEISLPTELPASARPQLSVDGIIIADTLKQITYIKRPANVKPNSHSQLYRLDNEMQNAQLQSIQFGHQAGRFIQIISGAQASQRFIISDLSALKSSSKQLVIK